MAPRREILDSEDDDSDFGDGSELAGAEAHEREVAEEEPHETAGIDSTDPSFFQRIYEKQQGLSDAQDVVPDTALYGVAASSWNDISSAPPPGQKLKEYSSLTSITEPVPASRKSKRTRDVHRTESIDLTNITTPRKGATNMTSDVWDVPPSTNSQEATKTYAKRKVAELSLEQGSMRDSLPDTQDPYAFPDATPPTKRNRRGTPSSCAQQPHESSPLMLLPTEEAPSSGRQTRSSRKKKASSDFGSTLPDTAPPSLYIAQSALTASQKQEYQVVNLSSDTMPDASEGLCARQLVGPGEMYRSSAATTIAYPTPSRVAPPPRLPGVTEEMSEQGISRTSLGYGMDYQQSSPDVLTDMTSSIAPRSSRRNKTKVVSSAGPYSSELEPPASNRRAKRKLAREVEDGNQELDHLRMTQENTEAPPQAAGIQRDAEDLAHITDRPEDHVGGKEFASEADRLHVDVEEIPAPTPKPAAKGKKGRKKKGAKTQSSAPELDEPIAAEEVAQKLATKPAEVTEPPANRKRGRARKSDPSTSQLEPEQKPEERPEKEKAESEPRARPASQPLAQADNNSQPNSTLVSNDVSNTIKEREEKENNVVAEKPGVVRDTVTDNDKRAARDVKVGLGAQKPQYRVGLSKKTRIAPLLKCLKKAA
ncbi:hypothetical protein C7999DRAFT_13407 [Corynascus novoguineensis]|uniref:AT hook domain-containing protein n=1 Tax=Corynascus novoguineensis TaxID=1126955 RepID=A0AAN7CUN6_9PEZI|nr:hypothetical protein C7999DRAFT_13407 [Corynascus novoguineensis]